MIVIPISILYHQYHHQKSYHCIWTFTIPHSKCICLIHRIASTCIDLSYREEGGYPWSDMKLLRRSYKRDVTTCLQGIEDVTNLGSLLMWLSHTNQIHKRCPSVMDLFRVAALTLT